MSRPSTNCHFLSGSKILSIIRVSFDINFVISCRSLICKIPPLKTSFGSHLGYDRLHINPTFNQVRHPQFLKPVTCKIVCELQTVVFGCHFIFVTISLLNNVCNEVDEKLLPNGLNPLFKCNISYSSSDTSFIYVKGTGHLWLLSKKCPLTWCISTYA